MCFLSLSLFKPRHLTQGRSERQRLGWSVSSVLSIWFDELSGSAYQPDQIDRIDLFSSRRLGTLTAYRRCVIPLHSLIPASEKAEVEFKRRSGFYLLSLSLNLNLPLAW